MVLIMEMKNNILINKSDIIVIIEYFKREGFWGFIMRHHRSIDYSDFTDSPFAI